MSHQTKNPARQSGLTIKSKIHFKNRRRGQKQICKGEEPKSTPIMPGNVPRISRLMALAIRFDGLIQQGEIQDYADLARHGHITRARATQIMNMLLLATDIQEEILFLPKTYKGRDPIIEHDIRQIIAIIDWKKQRRAWAELKKTRLSTSS